MKRHRPRFTLPALAVSLLLACGPETATDTEPPAAEPEPSGPSIAELAQAAVDQPSRPEADRTDDAQRKPAEVLAFFGIEPGMTVLDLLAGGGYYTELVSHIVGDQGRVLSHNNKGYRDFLGDALGERFADNRLPNATDLDVEVGELALEAESLDAVIYILGYHDIYFRPDEGSWVPIDGPALLANLFQALKPGGVLGIVDHTAVAGSSPAETGNTIHRIDEQAAIDEITAAGFVLDGSSDVLRNPDDDRTANVFDPAMRRKTDRFVLRFRKPE